MIDFFRNLIKPKYQPLNSIEIIKDNLIHNLDYLYSLQEKAEIFPVLKSNAYGHGLKEISKILNKTKAKMVAVDSFPEAQIVYKYFKGRVLFLNEMPKDVYRHCNFKRSEFVIYNIETLKFISRFKKRAKVHIFVNSGMNREGIDDLESFLDQGQKYLEKIEIVGFCSHLAEADMESNFNKKQENEFIKKLDILNSHKIFPKWVHLGNSAGTFVLKNPRINAFRPGLSFYGYNPFSNEHEKYNQARENLKPALRILSTISSVQKIRTGERVSYANSYQAEKDMSLAIIPFGYFEGLNYKLSNQSRFIYKDDNNIFWFKVLGNVCMNMTCLEVPENSPFSNNPEVLLGKRVSLVSELSDMDNSMENIAKLSKTIVYENLVRLNGKINRKII